MHFFAIFGNHLPSLRPRLNCALIQDKLRKELFDPAAEKFLPIVRDIISKSKSCFLVDSGLTWADFFFTERLYTFEQLVPGVLKQYPMLSTYVEKVYGVSPAVKKHVEARPYTTI